MSAVELKRMAEAWEPLSMTLRLPRNEQEYDALVGLLDSRIDGVGEEEDHPLASLMEVIGVLIEKYEEAHVPEIRA